jgi:hypothetical protein
MMCRRFSQRERKGTEYISSMNSSNITKCRDNTITVLRPPKTRRITHNAAGMKKDPPHITSKLNSENTMTNLDAIPT